MVVPADGEDDDDDAMDWEFQAEDAVGDDSAPEGQPELNTAETEGGQSVPAGLQDRENAFFKDLYSNPNLQKGDCRINYGKLNKFIL